MAIALPAVKFQASYPELVNSVSLSRSGKRIISFVEYADDFWQVEMQTKPLRASEQKLVESFVSKCKRGSVTILYTPKHVCVPRAYWGDANNAILTNTGIVTAITGGTTIAFNSVTTGLQIKEGDYIGLTTGAYNLIVRATNDVTAASSAVAGLTVDPPIPAYIAVGAVVTFKNPVMNMRMIPDSFQMPNGPFPVATFTLVEVPQ